MSYENWKNKAQGFQTVDVRHIQGSFFEGLKKRAEALEVGEGLHIIQTFEPYPLYAVMEGLGYEHHTERRLYALYPWLHMLYPIYQQHLAAKDINPAEKIWFDEQIKLVKSHFDNPEQVDAVE